MSRHSHSEAPEIDETDTSVAIRRLRARLLTTLMCVGIGGLVAGGVYVTRPLDADQLEDVATTVLAADGRMLELRLNSDGRWREQIALHEIDPDLVAAMLAYEDRRFYSHVGVDPIAIVRAALSVVTTGRVVSGASSVTMQVARLLNPDLRKRSLGAKIRQMWYALRLEYHWSKAEILHAYFQLAPYGGNVEGIKAASMAWLQKPPAELTMTEIGLLVALPQAPEQRRPDRHPQAAMAAKNHVLRNVGDHLAMDAEVLDDFFDQRQTVTPKLPPNHGTHQLHPKQSPP
ncbi:MAG: transglycosylase domain-containing protein, partial [Gammaproteobacteria bacterium]|nr:transglycosylase domain-containing protein [Gammaproteobacteria bacterium]